MSIFKRLTKEEKFWKWFGDHLVEMESISADGQSFQDLYKRLTKTHSSLVFEISPKDESNVRTLVISCDGVREGIPAVEDLVTKAPRIDGWKFVAFRPPIEDELTIELNGMKLSTSDVLFTYETAPDNTIDICLFIDGVTEVNKNEYLQVAFILLDASIGEYKVMTKIGHLDLFRLPKDASSLESITHLKSVI